MRMRVTATPPEAALCDARLVLIAPSPNSSSCARALVGVVAIALGGGPVGVFLMLRRMSLTGDAMAHAILPGAAVGYLVAGLSLPAMTIGGLARRRRRGARRRPGRRAFTALKEDASLAAFYLISLALGVTIVSLRGSNVDLLHVLFGTVLALDDNTLLLLASISTITVLALAVLYRPLVLECVDPVFLRSVSRAGTPTHLALPRPRRPQPRRRLPCARHAAGGGHDDAAGRRRRASGATTSPS